METRVELVAGNLKGFFICPTALFKHPTGKWGIVAK